MVTIKPPGEERLMRNLPDQRSTPAKSMMLKPIVGKRCEVQRSLLNGCPVKLPEAVEIPSAEGILQRGRAHVEISVDVLPLAIQEAVVFSLVSIIENLLILLEHVNQ